ncbi:MAG: SpoIID/LytB domain-containing protein [Actinomycetota bacterium]|nr:SpoIID/LytB domain-containing protein [Actinomycetota bacterium]
MFPLAVITAVLSTVLVVGSNQPVDTTTMPAETAPVPAKVYEHEVPVAEPEAAKPTSPTAKPEVAAPKAANVVAELPETTVKPFSMVGVTWDKSTTSSDLTVQVRWRERYSWSNWTELELDLENTATEGGRPGTEPQWVGNSDAVAVRVTSGSGVKPADLKVATIDPGKSDATTPVSFDTGSTSPATAAVAGAALVPKPTIILRSAWGASGGSGCDAPLYGETTRGTVIHHTAGNNSYTKAQSAGIVKATQAYHTGSRNWCDIGYNFLVDKYGQIFEGRKGGIDKTVRAAHSGNGPVNEETMGVSLMGTFSSVDATSAMKTAVVQLVSWRFSAYSVPAKGTYKLGGVTLNRIAGHRNVVSTECPGARVYSWLSASGGLRDRVEDTLSASTAVFATPKNLKSTATAKDSISLAWDSVPDAPQYRIQLSTSSNMANAVYYRFVPTSGTITGLKANTTYYAKVRVITADGGNLSNYSSPAITVKTASSSNVAPKNLRLSSATKDSLSVQWDAVPDAPKYRIQLSTSSNMANAVYYRFSPTSATITGLKANTKYYLKVRVITEDGVNLSPYSTPALQATTPASTAAPATTTFATPKNLKSTGTAKDSISFGWDAVKDAPQYRIQLSTSSNMANAVYHRFSPTTARITGLKSGTTYYAKVRVIAADGANLSPYSTSATSTKTAATTTTATKVVSESYTVPSSRSVALAGHGYGHGIGMGQYGAQGAAKRGLTYSKILEHYYPGTALGTKSGNIRVLLSKDSTDSVMVAGRSGLVFRNLATNKTIALPTTIGGKSVIRWSINPTAGKATQSSLQYRTGSAYVTYQNTNWTGDGQFEGPSDMTLILPNGESKFRGALRSALPKKGATNRDTLNVLSVEDYTRGVVSAEMPSSWMPEALKAQSVAARTYGVRSLTPGRYYDICDTTACQVYGGVAKETGPTDSAISATKSKVLNYNGTPAFTQFSSSNGGYSATGSQPYLKAVNDPYDDWSGNANHDWKISVPASKIEKAHSSIGTLKQLKITKRNGSGDWGGRVDSISLIGSKKTITITGNAARTTFGLKSNWFKLG